MISTSGNGSIADKSGPKAHSGLLADGRAIRAAIASYTRDPFQEILALFIEATPQASSIKAFAEQTPDKWAQSLRAMAGLAGYVEQKEVHVQGDLRLRIGQMSDAELLEALQQQGQVIDVSPELEAEPSPK